MRLVVRKRRLAQVRSVACIVDGFFQVRPLRDDWGESAGLHRGGGGGAKTKKARQKMRGNRNVIRARLYILTCGVRQHTAEIPTCIHLTARRFHRPHSIEEGIDFEDHTTTSLRTADDVCYGEEGSTRNLPSDKADTSDVGAAGVEEPHAPDDVSHLQNRLVPNVQFDPNLMSAA